MANITMRISDEDLAAIDAEVGESGGNRTQFMLDIVRTAIIQLRRERLDEEIGRLLTEEAEENLAIVREFDQTIFDGIE